MRSKRVWIFIIVFDWIEHEAKRAKEYSFGQCVMKSCVSFMHLFIFFFTLLHLKTEREYIYILHILEKKQQIYAKIMRLLTQCQYTIANACELRGNSVEIKLNCMHSRTHIFACLNSFFVVVVVILFKHFVESVLFLGKINIVFCHLADRTHICKYSMADCECNLMTSSLRLTYFRHITNIGILLLFLLLSCVAKKTHI